MISDSNSHITLKANHLAIGYSSKKQNHPIKDHISFDVYKGEVVAIIGGNGIGKSTLLRTLAGLQPKLEGSIQILHKNISHYSPKELASHLSVVLTENITTKNLTALELISLGRQPYTNWIGTLTKKDKDVITTAIVQTGLEDLKDKKCYELSDGQFQKVMIARALAQDTPIILLDEPTTHLDLYHTAQIIKLLKDIAHKAQKTIVFTTHEINIALQLSDKILILEKEATHYNTPSELIKTNCLDALFPNDTIAFDSHTQSFKIKN